MLTTLFIVIVLIVIVLLHFLAKVSLPCIKQSASPDPTADLIIRHAYPSMKGRIILILWDLTCIIIAILLGTLVVANDIYHNSVKMQTTAEGLAATTEIANRVITVYIFVVGFSFAACLNKLATMSQAWDACMPSWCELALEICSIQELDTDNDIKTLITQYAFELLLHTKTVAFLARKQKSSYLYTVYADMFKDHESTVDNWNKCCAKFVYELSNHNHVAHRFSLPANTLASFMTTQYKAQKIMSTLVLPYTVVYTINIFMIMVSAAITVKLRLEYSDEIWPYNASFMIMAVLYLPLFSALHMTPYIGTIFRQLYDKKLQVAYNSVQTIWKKDEPSRTKYSHSKYRQRIQVVNI